MWGVTEDRWSVNANRFITLGQKTPAAPNTGNGPAGEADGRQRKKKKEKAHILVYQEVSPAKEERWFRKLLDPKQTKEVPKPEQERFLRTVAHRCQYEASVQKMTVEKREKRKDFEPPQAYALLAPPGTGKTKCIKLVCEYFKEVQGWTQGIEFQCLASQNSMAGRIDGATLHSWAEVPIDRDNASMRDRKRSEKQEALKCTTRQQQRGT